MKNTYSKKMCELFAGVGGFRLGFERLNSGWETVWFSQWEPGSKKQHAHDCYTKHFGDCPDADGKYVTGTDIATVDKTKIPDHDLLVGGFPCQDYSVAQSLSSSRGIEGKKGVLWWQIRDILEAKRPKFCIFENVDRLLKSPAKQRGRDFGIILSCLSSLGYSAEWRVVNAADYGGGQRRRRVFIFAYLDDSAYGISMISVTPGDVIEKAGFMARAFPIEGLDHISSIELNSDIVEVSDNFKFEFENGGYMHGNIAYTAKVSAAVEPFVPLKNILQEDVDEKYFIKELSLRQWAYLKGAKKIERVSSSGHKYTYSEGPVSFPDSLEKPGRTMLTSEGTVNRSSHVVEDPKTGNRRILTPVEAERLNGFDDGWTDTGMPERMRYFCMGNALVVPMVSKMGKILDEILSETEGRNPRTNTKKERAGV